MKPSKSEFEQLDALLDPRSVSPTIEADGREAAAAHGADGDGTRQRAALRPGPAGGPGLVRPSTSEYSIADLAKGAPEPAIQVVPAAPPARVPSAPIGADAGQQRRRLISLLCVLGITLLGDSARGLFLPTQLQYVQSLGGGSGALGLAVASYSAGRLLFSPLLGAVADRRSFSYSLQLSLVLMAAGNLLYILVPALWAMLAARFVVGCGASTLGISRAYVVAVTTVEQRTAYMAYLSAVQFAGFAVMPGAGALLSALPELGVGPLRLDAVTAPAWLLVAASGALAAALARRFEEPSASKAEQITGGGVSELGRLPALPLAVCLCINFAFRGVLAVVETIGTVITSQYFHLEAMGSGLLFAAVGLLGMAVFLSIKRLSGRFGDAALVLAGLLLASLGFLALACLDAQRPHVPVFLAGLALVWTLGYPLGQTAILSLFSKLLGRRKQGAWMGARVPPARPPARPRTPEAGRRVVHLVGGGGADRVRVGGGVGVPRGGPARAGGTTAALLLAAAGAEIALHRRFLALGAGPPRAAVRPAGPAGPAEPLAPLPSIVVARTPSVPLAASGAAPGAGALHRAGSIPPGSRASPP
eukprot:tig00021682_g23101.t1